MVGSVRCVNNVDCDRGTERTRWRDRGLHPKRTTDQAPRLRHLLICDICDICESATSSTKPPTSQLFTVYHVAFRHVSSTVSLCVALKNHQLQTARLRVSTHSDTTFIKSAVYIFFTDALSRAVHYFSPLLCGFQPIKLCVPYFSESLNRHLQRPVAFRRCLIAPTL
jgi:hypothetical protein